MNQLVDFLTWSEAKQAASEGKEVYLHHEGRLVPLRVATTSDELQWNRFLESNLTLSDIVQGKYYLNKEIGMIES